MKQILTVILLVAGFKINAATDGKDYAMQTHIINNNGDSLYSIIYPNPEKETVILLHGGPGVPSDFTDVVNSLKENYQVITFHQRGTKKSPIQSHDYSMEAYLTDINAIAQFYNISTFHLFGHSWGGLYAQIYAEKYPEKLLSLFLCNPGSGTNTEWEQTEDEVLEYHRSKTTFWQWSLMGMNSVLGMMGSDKAHQRLFEQVVKNMNVDFGQQNRPDMNYDVISAEPINKTRPEIKKYPLLTIQEQPTYKITILYGDKDIYQTSQQFVINRYPTAKRVILSNCGHIPWQQNPDEFILALKGHYQ